MSLSTHSADIDTRWLAALALTVNMGAIAIHIVSKYRIIGFLQIIITSNNQILTSSNVIYRPYELSTVQDNLPGELDSRYRIDNRISAVSQ
jgi:hypothetical protein